MKFEHIVLFSIKDFNNNKEKDGYCPKDGEVINAYFDAVWGRNVIAVGYV